MADEKQYLTDLLMTAAQQGASDVHLSAGHYPTIRVDRRLVPLSGQRIVDHETLEAFASIMLAERKEEFVRRGELTFAFEADQRARFRASIYATIGGPAAVLRFIPENIPTLEQLNLPAIAGVFAKLSQGIVVVAAPSGNGATTTFAALVNAINHERAEKILTIEDPIEHLFAADKSIIDQRDAGVGGIAVALASALRQDANVVVVSDLETAPVLDAALAVAEAGRLVFGVIRTGSAVEALERIMVRFPSDRREEIRNRLAGAIAGSIAQRLVPHLKGGLVPAVEVMVATAAVRAHIREDRLRQIDQAIETGYAMGMLSLDRSLADLVRRREISLETAQAYASNPTGIQALVV